ncbi:MAG: phosphotransferase family protein [Polyangiaceae bacterium]|nr:phosphotransferase family protein [Polyangiaceae bacterium]
MSAPIDSPRAVRPGEELDLDKLGSFLSNALGGELAAPLDVQQFPSGHSNLTYLVRARFSNGEERQLVVRRPPFGNRVKTAHDMGREHRVLTALSPYYDKAPKPIVTCEDESIIGAPFYAMERISGVILRRKTPPGVELTPATLSGVATSFVDALVELHELPLESTGLASLGKPLGYVERQVTGWAKRYADAKTDEIPSIERTSQWLVANMPESRQASVIHNDFKYDNLVLDASDLTKIVGVLDWEMATVGDPLMDLGTALAYWVQSDDPEAVQTYTFGPTNLPGSPKRKEILEQYAKKRPGVVPDDMRFYYVFALFKNAVVAQQIYARYKRGATTDERFAMMIFAVGILGDAAVQAIDTGTF